MRIEWTARLVDPLRTEPVATANGSTPREAHDRLIDALRWKVNREHEQAARIDAALEVALRGEQERRRAALDDLADASYDHETISG